MTASVHLFTNGWFRIGDQGFLDPDHYLYFTERFKEFINRSCEQILPYEIENVLLDHPAIVGAVAFAVSDTRFGEDVADKQYYSRPI